MSTVRLACDGRRCGAVRQADPTENEADLRARLADVGWASVIHTEVQPVTGRRRNVVRDFCPPCAGYGTRALVAAIAALPSEPEQPLAWMPDVDVSATRPLVEVQP